jgi:hypothetical protein
MRYNITFRQMIDDSRQVLLRPTVASFNRYGRGGDALAAAKYVGAALLVGALIGWLASMLLSGGVGNIAVMLVNLVGSVLRGLLSFFFFVFLIQIVGQWQGGMGEFDRLSYSFALFYAPISLIALLLEFALPTLVPGGIGLAPLVGLLALVAYAVYAWQATKAAHAMRDSQRVAITLGGAILALILINLAFGGIAGGLL